MSQVDTLAEQLAIECPFWSKEDWRAFFSMDAADQAIVARGMALASIPGPSGKSGWEVALDILSTAATVVGDVTGVGSGIVAIKALVRG